MYEIFLFSANSAAICSDSLIITAEVGDVRLVCGRCGVNISSRHLDRPVWAGAAPRRRELGWHKRRHLHEGGTAPTPLPAKPSIFLGHIPAIPALSGIPNPVPHRACVQHRSSSPFLALLFGNVLAFIIALTPAEVSACINVLGSQSWVGFLIWAENS